jgi:hypothetical protein
MTSNNTEVNMISNATEATVPTNFQNGTVQNVHSNHTASQYIQFAEKNMIAGGIAGCIGKTMTAPLSRLTVLYQVGPLLQHTSSSHLHVKESLLSTFRSIVRQEGALSLWKGNFTSVIHRFPYSAVNFASFEVCKEQLEENVPSLGHKWIRMIAGAISGASSCIATYPLDIVRTRLTVGITTANTTSTISGNRFIGSSKILEVLAGILQAEGVRGMYRGLTASLAVAVPTFAISFTAYGNMKDSLLKQGGIFVNQKNGHLSPVGSLLSGSFSGVISSTLIFPLDVVRKRLQFQGVLRMNAGQRPSILSEIAHIYGTDGMRGFYRGLLAEVLKVCPMVALTFCSFELIKDAMNIYLP